MNTENLNIPRKNSDRVKEILATSNPNDQKAEEIWDFHNNCLARETDHGFLNTYTVHGIALELDGANGH